MQNTNKDIRGNIDNHPAHKHEFTFDNEDNSLRPALDIVCYMVPG